MLDLYAINRAAPLGLTTRPLPKPEPPACLVCNAPLVATMRLTCSDRCARRYVDRLSVASREAAMAHLRGDDYDLRYSS